MKGRFILIAALLAVLFSASVVRAQAVTTQEPVAPKTAQQVPVEKKVNLVITTASVHEEAKLGVALAAEIVAQAKTFKDANVTVNTDGGFVPVDADQTISLRLVANADPDDTTKTLFTLVILVHEKGNVFSFYLGSGSFKIAPVTGPDAQSTLEDYAAQILGYAQAAYSEYVQSNSPSTQQ